MICVAAIFTACTDTLARADAQAVSQLSYSDGGPGPPNFPASMVAKRRLSQSLSDDDDHGHKDAQHGSRALVQPPKRHRAAPASAAPPSRDILSTLSDELLLRVLSYFGVRELLDISLTSQRFHRLASDSQLWRAHYWRRFVRPRAALIPPSKSSSGAPHKLNFDGNRFIYADGGFGRNSGLVDPSDTSRNAPATDWKAVYKMKDNWERGRCYVDELQLGDEVEWASSPERRTFAKFVDGLAVTVDSCWVLRAWDLRSRKLIAHIEISTDDGLRGEPTCLSVDGQQLRKGKLGILVGFGDGTFGIWQLDVERKTLAMRYRHSQQIFGPVVSVAYMHPYVLSARSTGFIILHSFNYSEAEGSEEGAEGTEGTNDDGLVLSPPSILDTVKSVKTIPQAVSIRKVGTSFVASVAYSFNSISGWCIGIQDLDIKPSARLKLDAVTSRLASTVPITTRRAGSYSPDGSPLRPGWSRQGSSYGYHGYDSESDEDDEDDRPVSICYSHPYLLATMPDNTMMLHLCTSTPKSLTISEGTRLWGHTSGISDAVITPWGHAVSVTARGDEMRLWKVEGGFDRSSVEVRPLPPRDGVVDEQASSQAADAGDTRKWVAFDEERVIALKEKPNGRESFMVYDFT